MKEILKGLALINLDQPVEGYRDFISCWLLQKNGLNILIDPGPASTILHLTSALKKAGVEKIDLILLTHIHIDHAGGTGLLLKKFPEARVVCHPRAIKHLINPEKLWAGSLQVLGSLAEVYGPVAPVPQANLGFAHLIEQNGLTIEAVETPGHASHHLVYKIDDLLFLGEVAGVNVPLQGSSYLRIATPPVFKYEIYRASLQKAAQLKAQHFCFGHYGHRTDGEQIFMQALNQLEFWLSVIQKNIEKGVLEEDVILEQLLKKDAQLQSFHLLPADIQTRERYFCKNSIKGMMSYLLEGDD
ncbi:MBL fold metallo-hydrolase [Caldithrix abyssi]